MPLMQLVIALVLVGLLLYVVETLLPIDPTIKRVIHIVVILVVCLWLLQAFGIWGGGPFVGGMNTRPLIR